MIGAAAYFCVCLKKNKQTAKQIAVLCGVCAGLFAAAYLLVFLTEPLLSAERQKGFFTFEYYLTLCYFCGLIFVSSFFHKYGEHFFSIIAQGLIVFAFFSRIGCFFAGCCRGNDLGFGTSYIVILELLFSIVAFTVFFIAKPKYQLPVYLLAYSVFRFLTEFLRENEGIKTVAGLNMRQFIALIVIVSVVSGLICFTNAKNMKKENSAE